MFQAFAPEGPWRRSLLSFVMLCIHYLPPTALLLGNTEPARHPPSGGKSPSPQHPSAPALWNCTWAEATTQGALAQCCRGLCPVAHPHHGRACVCCSQQGPWLFPALAAAVRSCVLSECLYRTVPYLLERYLSASARNLLTVLFLQEQAGPV